MTGMTVDGERLDMKDCSEENIAMMVIYSTLAANDITSALLYELIEELKGNHLYKERQNIKREVAKCSHYRKAYEKRMLEIIGDRTPFFSDYCQEMESECRNHITMFQLNVLGEFEKVGIKDADIKSKCETAMMMANLACVSLDSMIREASPYVRNIKRLRHLRITDIYKCIDRLHDEVCFDKVHCDLNASKSLHAIVDILGNKLMDVNTIAKSIAIGEKLNPV